MRQVLRTRNDLSVWADLVCEFFGLIKKRESCVQWTLSVFEPIYYSYIYTFTFKIYAGPNVFVMFRKILSGTSKRIQYFI